MGRRSIVYIDGFNLYYGALKGGPHKWLHIQRMCERLRQDDDIQLIRYCTALVNGPTRPHQDIYLQALATCSKIEITLGKFKPKQFKCHVQACQHSGPRYYQGSEEKRTDVNIAVLMLDDAYQDRADRFVVISGDSDLVPAVNMVKERFGNKQVIVYVPTRSAIRGAAVELRSAADKNRSLPLELIARSQFPAEFPDGLGGVIKKPAAW